jgi:hypothetical protein
MNQREDRGKSPACDVGLVSRAVVAVIVLIVGASVAGCVDDGQDPLKDLEKDPSYVSLSRESMASFRPPGGRLESDFRLREGSSFGKPNDAHITRVFAYKDPQRARLARTLAVEAAQASGWEMNLELDDPDDPLFGGKMVATGGITLIIGSYKDISHGPGLYKVSVRLEHQKCGRGRCY